MTDAPDRQWYCFLERRFVHQGLDGFGEPPECGEDRQCTGGRRGGLACGWYELASPGTSAIVGALAASDPTVQTGDTVLRASPDGVQVGGPRSVRRCVLCGRDIVPALWPHDPSCPWLRSHVIGGTQ